MYEKTLSGGSITKYYFADDERVATRKAGVLTYISSDHIGGTALVTNTSAGVVSRLRYYPYGGTRVQEVGSPQTDRLYTGQRLDREIGLYNGNGQMYDTRTGRASAGGVACDPINKPVAGRLNPPPTVPAYIKPPPKFGGGLDCQASWDTEVEWFKCTFVILGICAGVEGPHTKTKVTIFSVIGVLNRTTWPAVSWDNVGIVAVSIENNTGDAVFVPKAIIEWPGGSKKTLDLHYVTRGVLPAGYSTWNSPLYLTTPNASAPTKLTIEITAATQGGVIAFLTGTFTLRYGCRER